MTSTTAYNHYKRLESKLNSIFSAAECYRPTFLKLLEQVKQEVYNDEAVARCPRWVLDGLHHKAEDRFNHIQQRLTIWLFPTDEGAKSWELLTEAERDSFASTTKTGKRYWLKETTGVGTISDRNRYAQGYTIHRSYEITGNTY